MCISEKMCIMCAGIVIGVLAIGVILTNYYKNKGSLQASPVNGISDTLNFANKIL